MGGGGRVERGGRRGKPQEVFALAGVNFSGLPRTDLVLDSPKASRYVFFSMSDCYFLIGYLLDNN